MMRSKNTLYLILFFNLLAFHAANAQVEITLNNIRSSKGNLRIGLFTEKEFFNTPAEGKIVKANAGSVTVIFDKVKSGTYAIGVIHDENENAVLDRTKLGIPKEGFAFGNNAFGKKGPPTFEQAKIVVGDMPLKQALKMKYF